MIKSSVPTGRRDSKSNNTINTSNGGSSLQTVHLKNSSAIEAKLIKHQLQDLTYQEEIIKAQAVVSVNGRLTKVQDNTFSQLTRAVKRKDLLDTKRCLEELKLYKRLDKVKEVIDTNTEWTLLHQSVYDNQPQILQDLLNTGMFMINQKDLVRLCIFILFSSAEQH